MLNQYALHTPAPHRNTILDKPLSWNPSQLLMSNHEDITEAVTFVHEIKVCVLCRNQHTHVPVTRAAARLYHLDSAGPTHLVVQGTAPKGATPGHTSHAVLATDPVKGCPHVLSQSAANVQSLGVQLHSTHGVSACGSQVWTLPGEDLRPVSLGGAGDGAASGGLLPGFVCRRFLMAKNDQNKVLWNHEAQKDKRILKQFRDDVSGGLKRAGALALRVGRLRGAPTLYPTDTG